MQAKLTVLPRAAFITGPRSVEVRDVDLEAPGPDDVLIKVLFSGISAGTEMNVYRGLAPQWRKRLDPRVRLFVNTEEPEWRYPLRYGYACVGTILEAGVNVKRVQVGDLVFAYAPHQTHVVMPAERVVSLGGLTNPEIGIFFANLNTAYNGILDARPPMGSNVVVFGLGVIGQLVIRLLAKAGLRSLVAVDTIASRRKLAEAAGAKTLDPLQGSVAEQVRELTEGLGADIVIEVSGTVPALHEAIRTAGYNGTVIAMSWYTEGFETLDLSGEFHHNRIQVRSSQVAGINPELGPLWTVNRRMRQAVAYLSDLDLEPLISHRIPLDGAALAYRLVDEQPAEVMQVVLTYPV